MKASEMIAALQAIVDEHGDVPVASHDTEWDTWHADVSISVRVPRSRADHWTADPESLGPLFVAITYGPP